MYLKIPFNRPFLDQKEIRIAGRVIRSGKIGGDRIFSARLEALIKNLFKTKYVLLTTSCTHALELALMALEVTVGDEVILPSFSFVSAANAIALRGARPVFVDIEENYLNIDPAKIKEAITPKTKAIICVHYAGASCQMQAIRDIARKKNLAVIEDAAHALGSKFRGRYLGTIGTIGCYSFHETKNITCGEGGAFLTQDEKLARKAEIIREKGTNRSAFLRGEIDKYTWINKGSSYALSDILAAVVFEQMKKIDYIIDTRKEIGLRYIEKFKGLEEEGKIILPKFKQMEDFNWHIFYFRTPTQKDRDRILREMKKRGIEATFHFLPLHSSPFAKRDYNYKKSDLPITNKVSRTLVRLPICPSLSRKEQKYISDSLIRILS